MAKLEMAKVEPSKKVKIKKIDIAEIKAPIKKKTIDEDRPYLRWEVTDFNDVSYRFNTSDPCNKKLEEILDKGMLPYISLEEKEGTFKNKKGSYSFKYVEVELPEQFKDKFEKKIYKSFRKEVETTDDSESIIWDN